MQICPVVKEHQNNLNGYTDLTWLMEHIKTCAHCTEIMQFMIVSLESVLDVGAVEPIWSMRRARWPSASRNCLAID